MRNASPDSYVALVRGLDFLFVKGFGFSWVLMKSGVVYSLFSRHRPSLGALCKGNVASKWWGRSASKTPKARVFAAIGGWPHMAGALSIMTEEMEVSLVE